MEIWIREKLILGYKSAEMYGTIHAGLLCNDWMVDAVLYCQSEMACSKRKEQKDSFEDGSSKELSGN